MEEYIFRAEISTEKQLQQALSSDDFQYIYAPIDLLSEKTEDKFRIIIVPPVYMGNCQPELKNRLTIMRQNGFSHVLAHTVGHLELINELQMTAHGGHRLNIENSLMEGFLEANGLADSTLSIELTVSQALAVKCSVPKGLITYGKLPLMITRRCPINDGKPCGGVKKCGKRITDRKGNELLVSCGTNAVEILNPDTLILSDKLGDFSDFDFLTLKFTDEEDILSVLEMYQSNGKPSGNLTRGLYYRGTE